MTKINNKAFDLSMNDSTELRKLIMENPDLPLLIFCGEDGWHDIAPYEQTDARCKGIEELTLYGEMWRDKDDYIDALRDDLASEEEYIDLSDEEFDRMIEEKVKETEFCKAIVVYVG